MALQTARRLMALAGASALAFSVQLPAQADTTFTHITAPSDPHSVLIDGATPVLTYAGTASGDVTAVDIVCFRGADDVTVANNVPVTAGAFSVDAPSPTLDASGPACRLRALPHGVAPDPNLTAFSGPVLYIDRVQRTTDGSNTVDFRLFAATRQGQLSAASAGRCGVDTLGTLEPDLSPPSTAEGCVGTYGGTSGSLIVDGHPALLPSQVNAFTDGQSTLTAHFGVAKSGQLTWTESATLLRCPNTDTFPPPSPGACGTPLLSTGVTFQRTGTLDASGHEVRLRDVFSSADSQRHRLRASYSVESTAPSTGGLGFAFPGRTGGFHPSSAGQVVTGLPQGAATALLRTDRFSAEGDPQANTRAVTWSRTPSRLAFSASTASAFGLAYSLLVPKGGSVRLGLTVDQAILTSAAKRLGASAVRAMMPSPTITSPANGAVLTGKKTVVKGTLRSGVNGLPVSLTVNGHPALITPTSASRAKYQVVFDEPPGKHVLTAVARDAGGNKRTASITVRNK